MTRLVSVQNCWGRNRVVVPCGEYPADPTRRQKDAPERCSEMAVEFEVQHYVVGRAEASQTQSDQEHRTLVEGAVLYVLKNLKMNLNIRPICTYLLKTSRIVLKHICSKFIFPRLLLSFLIF